MPTLALLRRFAADQRGATALEYGLIVAGLSIVVAAAVTGAGQALYNTLSDVSDKIRRT